ncbi:MAG: phosphatase PAP2 family protein [Bacteroidetes bacterium]|nr:phosphatase PAP2 family protein [Bacteroidota bacterium]
MPKRSSNKLFTFLSAYGLLLLVGGALLISTTQTELFLWMNAQHAPWADAIAPWLTLLGDGRTAALLPLVLYAINRPLAWRAAVALTLTLLLVQAGKQLIFPDALRPTAYFEALGTPIEHLIPGVEQHRHQSFPSGHTAAAFAIASLLCLIDPPKPLVQYSAGARQLLLLTLAFAVGYTRVYLSQHFFEDVLAGSFLGVFSVALTIGLWPLSAQTNTPQAKDGGSKAKDEGSKAKDEGSEAKDEGSQAKDGGSNHAG